MIKRSVAFSALAWATAAIMSASPANALVGVEKQSDTDQPSTYVLISANYKAEASQIVTDDGQVFNFSFKQRMTVEGGHSMFVAVEFVYPVGRRELVLVATSSGHFVYGAGSCAC